MKYKLLYQCLVGILLFCGTIPAMSSPPDWAVQPQGYANTSNIIAYLQVNGQIQEAPDNIIGFFVGGEVRAVAEPMMMGNDAIYFITAYSNQLSGEAMSMRVYIAADDATYTSPDLYTFQKSNLLGSLEEPHIIRIYSDGDFPIGLEEIPEQITLQGQSFLTIDLNDFLIREDNDFINWSYVLNSELEVDLSGSLLTVTAIDPEWIGSTFLDIKATELTSNQYNASQRVVFTVKESFMSPEWDGLPGYTVEPGELFPAYNLNDYEHTYDGNCLEFSVEPVLEIPDPWFPEPDWSVNPRVYQYTMTTIHKVQFSEYYTFSGLGDLLGAFVGEEVRGVASPIVDINGDIYYFLTTYSNTQEELTFKYYSEEFRNIYEVNETLMFVTNFSNSIVETIILDVAPIKVDILEFGGAIIYVCDETWTGSQDFRYTVQDCNDPTLSDEIIVTYTINDGSLATELIRFGGEWTNKETIDLSWEVTSSADLHYFEIERSHTQQGQQDWSSIGKVEQANHDWKHYTFTDQQPLAGINYYRLKIVEKSGEYTYSNVIVIDAKPSSFDLSIYPNPVIGQELYLQWAGEATNAQVKIFETNTRLIFEQNNMSLNQSIQLPDLASGLYFIEVQTPSHTYLEKLVVP